MKALVLAVSLTATAFGQVVDPSAAQAKSAEPSPALPPNSAKQMQLDLDQMESLLNNMATEVSFIQDTNLQILLSTNVRLWGLLLRDLRLQATEKERHDETGQVPK